MSFWFNGISSDDKHVVVEKYPDYTIPARKFSTADASGRTGTIYITTDGFANIKQAYQVYMHDDQYSLEYVARSLAEWLLSPSGYCNLTDSYNPHSYRKAIFTGPINIQNIFNKYGRVTLEFDCDPRRWLVAGDVSMALGINDTTYFLNPSSFEALPEITATFKNGSETISFSTVNENDEIVDTYAVISAPSDLDTTNGETFTFNSETGQITDSLGNNASSRFSLNPFPSLVSGVTAITTSNFTTGSASVVPHWFTL